VAQPQSQASQIEEERASPTSSHALEEVSSPEEQEEQALQDLAKQGKTLHAQEPEKQTCEETQGWNPSHSRQGPAFQTQTPEEERPSPTPQPTWPPLQKVASHPSEADAQIEEERASPTSSYAPEEIPSPEEQEEQALQEVAKQGKTLHAQEPEEQTCQEAQGRDPSEARP